MRIGSEIFHDVTMSAPNAVTIEQKTHCIAGKESKHDELIALVKVIQQLQMTFRNRKIYTVYTGYT